MGGYPQVKFSPRMAEQMTWNNSYTDLPLIRYAEILLMYVEAKAELGELKQDDVDRTINLLRDRELRSRIPEEWIEDSEQEFHCLIG